LVSLICAFNSVLDALEVTVFHVVLSELVIWLVVLLIWDNTDLLPPTVTSFVDTLVTVKPLASNFAIVLLFLSLIYNAVLSSSEILSNLDLLFHDWRSSSVIWIS
jgi:hypothetical protein